MLHANSAIQLYMENNSDIKKSASVFSGQSEIEVIPTTTKYSYHDILSFHENLDINKPYGCRIFRIQFIQSNKDDLKNTIIYVFDKTTETTQIIKVSDFWPKENWSQSIVDLINKEGNLFELHKDKIIKFDIPKKTTCIITLFP